MVVVSPFMAPSLSPHEKESGKGFVTNPHTAQLSHSYAHFLQVDALNMCPRSFIESMK